MQLAGTATMVLPASRAFRECRYVSISPHAAHDRVPGRMNSSLGNSLAALVDMVFLFRILGPSNYSAADLNPFVGGRFRHRRRRGFSELFRPHVPASEAGDKGSEFRPEILVEQSGFQVRGKRAH